MRKIPLILMFVCISFLSYGEPLKLTGGKMLYFNADLFSFGVFEDGIDKKHDVFTQRVDDAMSVSPKAAEYYKSAKDNNLMSNVTGLVGVGALVTAFNLTGRLSYGDTSGATVILGVTLGSIALMIAAEVYAFATYNDIYMAVHEYNKSVTGFQSSIGRDVFLVKRFEF